MDERGTLQKAGSGPAVRISPGLALTLLGAFVACALAAAAREGFGTTFRWAVSTLTPIPAFVFSALLFTGCGLWLPRWVGRNFTAAEYLATGFVGSCVVGYLSFWIHFANVSYGRAFSYAVTTATVIAAIAAFARSRGRGLACSPRARSVIQLVKITVLAGLVYFCYFNAVRVERSQIHLAMVRWGQSLPADNALPFQMANRLYEGRPLKISGEWQSSDRPPLLAGIVTVFYPIFYPLYTEGDYYGGLSAFTQLLWIAALWLLAETLGVERRVIRGSFGYCLLSGFFILNSLYTWPKLLAGALVIFSLSFLLRAGGGGRRVFWPLAGVAFVLAMLSHGGAIFSLPLFAVLFLGDFSRGGRPAARGAALAGVAAILCYLPWLAYQRWYDPPGDRLLKWHLAGVIEPTARSFGALWRESYANLSARQFLFNKVANLTEICRLPAKFWDAESLRSTEFFSHLFALGGLNVGWFYYPRISDPRLRRILAGALTSLFVWAIAIFIPYGTTIHQGSYGTTAILFFALAWTALAQSPRLVRGLWAAHLAYFFYVWFLTAPREHSLLVDGVPNPLLIPLGILAGVSLWRATGADAAQLSSGAEDVSKEA